MAAAVKRAFDTNAETPEKVSTQAASDEKLRNFLQWCKINEIHLSSKVCVESTRSVAQFGMIATEDINPGETLFSIPRTCLLCPQNSAIAKVLQQGQQELGDGSWVPLLLALVHEYNNPQSFWRPYLDLVPDFSQLDLPMFWDSSELSKLLKGTGVVETVSQDLSLMEKDFNTKALPFMNKHPAVFSAACRDLQLYKRMVAFVLAYSFTEPVAEATGEHWEEEDEEEESGPNHIMMVPVADLLNHVAKNNAALSFHHDCLTMVSTAQINKGEEVFNTYGDLANKHLIQLYGFAECYPLNHFDTVDIPVAMVTEVVELSDTDPELLASKLHFLQEQELHQAGESYVVGKEGVLTDEELETVLKVLVMTREQFAEHAEKQGWSDADSQSEQDTDSPLSFENIPRAPESWKNILSRCAHNCLSGMAGDAEKDAAAMETEGKALSSRERYALFVRYGQRQLLQQLINACR